MPVLVLQPPSLPPLQTYIALSCLSLAWCFLYARDTLETVETAGLTNPTPDTDNGGQGISGDRETGGWSGGINESQGSRYLFGIQEHDSEIVKLCRIMMADVWSVLSLINLAFCFLILLGRLLQHVVFGQLRAGERQHMRDKLWKFIFYKFIIIFGVLNVQTLEEMVMWMAWFGTLAFLHTLSSLCKDRFEYLSFSPSSLSWAHGKVLLLLVAIVGLCKGLILLSCYMGAIQDWNVFFFTVSEVILLELRTIYVLIRYWIHFYDLRHEGVWERRGSIMYYSDLVIELLALSVDFVHHFHMLLWGNVFLSMASLVICMELRYLYNEIQRRVKRHRNYRRVVQNMQANFPLATEAELLENNDDCAICWEEMKSARKLPCNHFFHNACLRSWLEHETSCPTCRYALNIRNNEAARHTPAPQDPRMGAGLMEGDTVEGQAQPVRPRRGRGHFFHFDGSRIASWIPSFSVEVSHRHLVQRRDMIHTSQLNNMATQVQQMFPNYPVPVLIEDLRVTRSMEVTVDNILEGRLVAPPESGGTDNPPTPTPSTGQTPPPSADPSPSNDLDTTPAMYDVPATTITESVRQLGLTARGMERVWQGGGDSNYQQSRGMLSEDRDAGRETELDASTSVAEDNRPSALGDGPQALPARFSKSSAERENSLKQRKELLLQQARKRFQNRQAHSQNATATTTSASMAAATQSSPGSGTTWSQSANQNPSSRDSFGAPSSEEEERTRRRAVAYEAAIRRMAQQQ
ncbi:E3 ubiquitin-protein ligase AMFR-like [Acanthaster planci]|uniref:E3 ubiquitin-protein ligase AMFR n=1 Tax=Acanthaster planci TaxID=133434 RepID=A0A8B7XQC7_ACAPL|nr:E3 ubiquitin-protein ligase AMFR-like [Acanthaster planci]XP_022082377.1 E3 ubiquitin-protein ligase AMFR-like [Acanthaster planci]